MEVTNNEFFKDSNSVDEIKCIKLHKYNEIVDIMEKLADKVEELQEENRILKKSLESYKVTDVEDFLGKYREILEM